MREPLTHQEKRREGSHQVCDVTKPAGFFFIEHLRPIRADVGDVKNDMRDVKARLASIESYIATLHTDQTRIGVRPDDIVQRVERLEKRTGLVEA